MTGNGSASTRQALIMCWLIASENDGALPKPADLAFRFRMTEKQIKFRHFKAFSLAGAGC